MKINPPCIGGLVWRDEPGTELGYRRVTPQVGSPL
ncbi:hypothetical protein ACVW0L_002536, partial [Thermostichus sp. OS-CIW-17]